MDIQLEFLNPEEISQDMLTPDSVSLDFTNSLLFIGQDYTRMDIDFQTEMDLGP